MRCFCFLFLNYTRVTQFPCGSARDVGLKSVKLWTTTRMGVIQMLWSYNALCFLCDLYLFSLSHFITLMFLIKCIVHIFSSACSFANIQDYATRRRPGPDRPHNLELRYFLLPAIQHISSFANSFRFFMLYNLVMLFYPPIHYDVDDQRMRFDV